MSPRKVTDFYRILSHCYGDLFSSGGDPVILNKLIDSFSDGTLHDLGFIVIDRKSGETGILLDYRLDKRESADLAKLGAVSEKYSIDTNCLCWPAIGNIATAYYAVTAYIGNSPDMIEKAEEISCELQSCII